MLRPKSSSNENEEPQETRSKNSIDPEPQPPPSEEKSATSGSSISERLSSSGYSASSDSSWIFNDPLVPKNNSNVSLNSFLDDGIRKDPSEVTGSQMEGSYEMSTDPRKLDSYGSINSGVGSAGSVNSADGKRRVRFRDEGLNSGISLASNPSGSSNGLVDVMYFDSLMNSKEPWEDPNFYAGFKEIFAADQLWIHDITFFACQVDSTYEITNREGRRLFYLEKLQDSCLTWSKFLCLWPCTQIRSGFTLNLRSLTQSLLVNFIRKSLCCRDQLDIVECFHSREEVYIGRIERTRHGFILRDKENEDIYRVIHPRPKDLVNLENSATWCSPSRKEMTIFRTDNKEVVGHLVYSERSHFSRLFSCCLYQPLCGILCNPDMGTNAKILLLGTLFFQLHRKEPYRDMLPLSRDAVQPQGHFNVVRDAHAKGDRESVSQESIEINYKSQGQTNKTAQIVQYERLKK